MAISKCTNCESTRLYRTKKPVSAGGGYAPDLLPSLGKWWTSENFDVVVCEDCGLMRFFASQEARRKLRESDKWEHV